MTYKILFSNIGYAKGIDGSLQQHIGRLGRHLYCDLRAQEQVLAQLKKIILTETPDLCCFVEIDQGSFHSARYNQIEALLDEEYAFHDIADKYGPGNPISRLPLHKGKSNAFMAKHDIPHEKLYFSHGTKRLIYKLNLLSDLHLFFAHFSLNKKIRVRQFAEVRQLIEDTSGEVIVLADFNILQGFSELKPLLESSNLILLNREDEHTFRFHKRQLTLDLCLCSKGLAERCTLKIIPQPFSDHAALLLELKIGIGHK